MRILASAQDFGLGPLAMLDTVTSQLPRAFEVDYWLPEHLSSRLSQVCQDTSNLLPYSPGELPPNLSSYDAMVVACDYDLVNQVGDAIPSAVIFDMLLWFWPELPEPKHNNYLIVAQNFFGVPERAREHLNVAVVNPFQTVSQRNRGDGKGTLINLGGFSSPLHHREMADTYLGLILPAIENFISADEEVTLAGGDSVLSVIEGKLPAGNFSVQNFSHDSMHRAIADCRQFISIPGIGSIYESASARAPTFFLPPTNMTQLLQAESLHVHLGYPHVFLPYPVPTSARDISVSDEKEFINSLFQHYNTHSASMISQLNEGIKRFKRDIETSSAEFEKFAEQLFGIMRVGMDQSPVSTALEHFDLKGELS